MQVKDHFIRKLQDSVNEVKASREMGARYMTFEQLLKDEREEERVLIAEIRIDTMLS